MPQAALRFDKVALKFVKSVQNAVGKLVPEGKLVVFAVTAPIRMPAKTAAALEEEIAKALVRRAARVKLEVEIHGNDCRIWVVAEKSGRSKAIGLVHNPGVSSDVLLATALSQPRRS
ncbi:MAG TPA: hypothetical protein VFF63_00795 [Candidatus Babeliales bacterium]|nr:hypothetical protein [Candidatus Babeliales bacterium]